MVIGSDDHMARPVSGSSDRDLILAASSPVIEFASATGDPVMAKDPSDLALTKRSDEEEEIPCVIETEPVASLLIPLVCSLC